MEGDVRCCTTYRRTECEPAQDVLPAAWSELSQCGPARRRKTKHKIADQTMREESSRRRTASQKNLSAGSGAQASGGSSSTENQETAEDAGATETEDLEDRERESGLGRWGEGEIEPWESNFPELSHHGTHEPGNAALFGSHPSPKRPSGTGRMAVGRGTCSIGYV